LSAERRRLREADDGAVPWKVWGPYLAERQWGTVREDYSPGGTAWEYFPHDHARSRAYRWGEDGIAGLCDDAQHLCFSLALWNGRDPILKERLFGARRQRGQHGEDVKEYYYYLDNTPTHSYMRMLYKYPQRAFPYDALVERNRARGRGQPEFELVDTGAFDDDRYFDVFVETAKRAADDLLILVTVHNRGPDDAPIHLIPQLVFRNTWSWRADAPRPVFETGGPGRVTARHPELGTYRAYADSKPEVLLTENETNTPRLFGGPAGPGPFKDAFHDYVIGGERGALASSGRGTKMGFHHVLDVPAGEARELRLRLTPRELKIPFRGFDRTLEARRREADEFYDELLGAAAGPGDDARRVARQAYAGMLWSKQWYHFDVDRWLSGDPAQPEPPPERLSGRNRHWRHLSNADVISMPDKWEFPWYAAWDLAFHCLPLARLDPEFAKRQLVLLTRDWYMHPDGQLPAYEWAFGDVNPPVHAWAAWRVYQIDAERAGRRDRAFLERVFLKLLLNFTWWVNRKDAHGDNLFQGGFLGLDNIGVFDRSAPLPIGGHIEQADGTSWMAMYSLNMMRIALELALEDPVYQDLASKFFEHFLQIAAAMANVGGSGIDLWSEEDEFFYDVAHFEHAEDEACRIVPLEVRSIVGLSPLFAVEILEPELLDRLPAFKERLEWLLRNRPELAALVSRWHEPGSGDRRLLSLLRGHRMKRLLARMLDETEFLSEYGVRALSKFHDEHPFELRVDGTTHAVAYEPGEGASGLFGGNSNWRGPVWFPVNFLLVESLEKFHHYYGDEFKIECPVGSGKLVTLEQAAREVGRRLTTIFLRDDGGRRAVFGDVAKFQEDPHFRDHVPFYEYFHGDTGRGLGAAHQTGWTGLVTELLGR